MIGRILTLVLFIISVMMINAQGVVGDWEGVLNVQGTDLKVVFHITENDETYMCSMDSPNQGAFDIKMDETKYDKPTLTLKHKQMRMETEAVYDEQADVIKGTFNQGPMSLPLELSRVEENKEAPTNNHEMSGDWNTAVETMGMQLRLVIHITESDGELSATMDSPDQGAFGIDMDEVNVDENNIEIKAQKMGLTIKGTYVPDSSIINAKFMQGPLNQDIILTREEVEKKELNRPQEPTTFPYQVEEVTYINPDGGHKMAGTLTIPESNEFEKVVVLVSGSGPQDRNEELLGHKPFLVLSDHLTKEGIAVLRYDDRGVGESEGDFGEGTSMDFASDAKAAVEYLRTRDDMNGKKIGIMGHSEGGLIAPIVATITDLDFIVSLAGPGVSSVQVLLEQTEAINRANGEEEDEIAFGLESSKLIFDYIKASDALSLEEMQEGMREILKKQFAQLSEEDLKEVGDVDVAIEAQVKSVSNPWFRYFMSFDPAVYLEQVTIPVLAVNGSLDLQVLADSNLGGIEKSLKKAGNTNYTLKKFDGLNHLFQVSADGTGSPNEYGKLEETFNVDAMNYIANWVNTFDQK